MPEGVRRNGRRCVPRAAPYRRTQLPCREWHSATFRRPSSDSCSRSQTRAQRSGSGLERSHSGATETCRYSARRGEGYGACDDEGGGPTGPEGEIEPTPKLSLPQSPAVTAPLSEGAAGVVRTHQSLPLPLPRKGGGGPAHAGGGGWGIFPHPLRRRHKLRSPAPWQKRLTQEQLAEQLCVFLFEAALCSQKSRNCG